MPLRPHQANLQAVCSDIISGAPIKAIIADVTPGGGKSKLPVILASMLIPKIADRLVWVVPRNSLKYQGEAEFVDTILPTDKRLRATDGNDANPDRGTDGYITTYQAIGQKPAAHVEYTRRHRTILFLDENHHASDDSNWEAAIRPMVEFAVLVVYASGTLSRGDGAKIAFLDYTDSALSLRNSDTMRVIRYPRRRAIDDGAILPVYARVIDGAAEWIAEDGTRKRTESIRGSGDDRSAAVYTALRTDYAFQLLGACITDWERTRQDFPAAKLLVVAPNIAEATRYHQHLARHYLSEIATSDDTPAARKAIDGYRRGVFPVLVTVAMAYEGLSVREITHIACLTQIRTVPWLEQCFARANRVTPGKRFGVVYGPADHLFLGAMHAIKNEIRAGVKDEPKQQSGGSDGEGFGGSARLTIEPLWSSAHGVASMQPEALSPSVMEGVLRDNIRAIRRDVVSKKRAGAIQSAERVFNLRVRAVVDKAIDDMDVAELTSVWTELRRAYRVGSPLPE